MNLIKNLTPTKRIDYCHYIEVNEKQYIREETLSLEHYRFEGEDKIRDFHTITWRLFDIKNDDDGELIEYYSCDMGWSKDNKLDKSNPIPKIEIGFKETIGKDLIYF